MSHSTDNASRAPVYVVLDGDVMLDAPIKAAWTHVLNYPSWQNYSVVQHLSGKAGQEGELVLLKKDESGAASTAYFARTIKLEPEKRVIWKIFREKPAEGEATFGIVEFGVEAMGSKTRFTYKVLYEFAAPLCSESELQVFQEQRYQGVRTLLATVLPKLCTLVKSS